MIKTWDISYNNPKGIVDDKMSKYNGKCKESIILEPDVRYERLMTMADNFKNDLSRGAENLGAIKRQIFCSDLTKRLMKD